MSIFSSLKTSVEYIADSAVSIAKLAIKAVADYLEEDMIRSKQKSIRAAKKKYLQALEENEELLRRMRRSRKEMEYLRRGALITYYKHRKSFLIGIRNDIKSGNQDAWENVRAIKVRIQGLPGWNEVGPNEKQRFRAANDTIHEQIGRLKSFQALVQEQIDRSDSALSRLYDSNSHGRLGGKKEIQEFLERQTHTVHSQFKKSDVNGLYLPFESTSLVLERKCVTPGCRTYLAHEMTYCFVCGSGQEQGLTMSSVREFENALPCRECGIELDETFPYCFNCGVRNDPFGLVEVLQFRP